MKFLKKKINKQNADKYKIFVVGCLLLLINLVSVFNISAIASSDNTSSSASLKDSVSNLEMRFFAHNYSENSIDKRIDRLEEFVFGMTKSGSEQERVAGLLQIVPDLTDDSTKNDQANEGTQTPATPNLTAEKASEGNTKDDKSDTESGANDESYPAVTALEQKILGHTNEKLSIENRLTKLETKAFGKPSQSTDLSDRVDLLQQYLSNKGIQNDDNLTTDNEPAVSWGSHPLGLTQQISALEKQVFGKVYAKDKLTSRLHKLEKKVFPGQTPETFAPIAARISRLQAAVQPQQKGADYSATQSSINNQSSTTGQIEPFTSSSPNANNFAYQPGMSGNTGYDTLSSNSNPAHKHHSLLHKIGQVAGVAGAVAIKSVGSMGMGGYGYGYPSSGYGYSQYGTGSSSMYGYGSSPFGSPLGTGSSYW